MTRHHVLKIDGRWFDRLVDGSKTAEVRKHDRDYQIGDRLIFVRHEWQEMGRDRLSVIEATISHILPASVFPDALMPGHSVLSLVDLSEPRTEPINVELVPAGRTA